MADTDITVVTYKGTGPLTNDLLGNHVSLGFNTIPASVSDIRGRAVGGIAVAAPERSAALLDVPTAAESGLPGFEAIQFYGLAAPSGTPRPIVDQINKELRAILTSDEMKKAARCRRQRSRAQTPEEYGDNIKREEGKWAVLVAKLGLKLE